MVSELAFEAVEAHCEVYESRRKLREALLSANRYRELLKDMFEDGTLVETKSQTRKLAVLIERHEEKAEQEGLSMEERDRHLDAVLDLLKRRVDGDALASALSQLRETGQLQLGPPRLRIVK